MEIKKLSSTAIVPKRMTEGSAGHDLYADLKEEITINPGETKLINTGLAIALDPNTVGLIFARSGLATRRGLRPANCVGVIDLDYRGEVLVALHNDSNKPQKIKYGERIAQLVILPVFIPFIRQVKELSDTQRANAGFGSTGV